MPPSFSTINRKAMDRPPKSSILPLTIIVAVFSFGFCLKHPLKISSNKTAAVEFSTTDNELNYIK